MKSFSSFTMVRQHVDVVSAAMRDRLPEIARTLDDLDGIELLDRVADVDGGIRLLNRWTARQKIPAALEKMLGTTTIAWLDRVSWNAAASQCDWEIEPLVLTGKIRCSGRTRYEPAMAGRGTRVTFEGQFELQPGILGGAASSLEPVVMGFLESVIANLIPRNLARAVVAAGELVGREQTALTDQKAVMKAKTRIGGA